MNLKTLDTHELAGTANAIAWLVKETPAGRIRDYLAPLPDQLRAELAQRTAATEFDAAMAPAPVKRGPFDA